MSFADDLKGLVERLVALDPQDHAALLDLKEAARERLERRKDRSMSSARAAAVPARRKRAAERAEQVYPKIVEARAKGCTTLKQIALYLEESGVPAPQGGLWHPSVIMKIEDAGKARNPT